MELTISGVEMNKIITASELNAGAVLKARLPSLRRFARALVGDQSAGDSLVLAALQEITDDKTALEDLSSPVTALYKSFISIFNGPIGKKCIKQLDNDSFPLGCDITLSALSPETRQAFLLTTMEGFSDDSAAEILGYELQDFIDLKQRAQDEVTQQLSASVFIIEDEMLIASDLEDIVTELGHLVIGTATTRDEAVKKLRNIPADVILSDIKLADDSSGIDAVNDLLSVHENVAVIFITAFAERLLTGLHPEPTFLIEKPFTKDQIAATLSQILFLKQTCALPKHAGGNQLTANS